ncbi:MAG: Gfo/Idh/MocA family protein [Thermodesulfobacteriota bacterium]
MNGYRALIIGAGKIGAFYDTPDFSEVLSHAHAYTASADFRLAGFVDSRVESAERAAGIWGGRAYTNLAEAFRAEKPDVISVCVPDDCHEPILRQISELGPRLVFAEKPLAADSASAWAIARLYQEKGIPLAVNYSRGYLPKLRHLANAIHSGSHGRFVNGVGLYGKGLMHNGSHMIDLLLRLLGPLSSAIRTGALTDWSDQDPSISASIRMRNGGTVFLQAVDSRIVTIFELDLIFERARIRLVDSCAAIEVYHVQEHESYRGYPVFRLFNSGRMELMKALPHAIDNICAHLETGAPLSCSGLDACRVIADCELVRNGKAAIYTNGCLGA